MKREESLKIGNIKVTRNSDGSVEIVERNFGGMVIGKVVLTKEEAKRVLKRL